MSVPRGGMFSRFGLQFTKTLAQQKHTHTQAHINNTRWKPEQQECGKRKADRATAWQVFVAHMFDFFPSACLGRLLEASVGNMEGEGL